MGKDEAGFRAIRQADEFKIVFFWIVGFASLDSKADVSLLLLSDSHV